MLSKLDALLCLVTLGFILQYEQWRMYRPVVIVWFEERVYFYELMNIQVQYLQLNSVSSSFFLFSQ